jgi:hypothetical protein
MTNPYRAMCAELLAQPVAEEPTDEELLRLAREWNSGFESIELHFAADYARAVLARWGRPTLQPVAVAPYREVADLVVWLEDHSAECLELDQPEWSKSINQAARFLHLYLRATPQPVAVSERLPRPEDCDEKGRCWWHRYTPTKEWHLQRVYIGRYNYWLPANALPTPEAT